MHSRNYLICNVLNIEILTFLNYVMNYGYEVVMKVAMRTGLFVQSSTPVVILLYNKYLYKYCLILLILFDSFVTRIRLLKRQIVRCVLFLSSFRSMSCSQRRIKTQAKPATAQGPVAYGASRVAVTHLIQRERVEGPSDFQVQQKSVLFSKIRCLQIFLPSHLSMSM